jgi:glutathione S-transferase
MELYAHPLSTASRAILLFEAESDLKLDLRTVDLSSGERLRERLLSISPNGLVPVLVDRKLRLTETSAILKYLALRTGSSAYPGDLPRRAVVDERIDWINANLYPSFGYDLVYPQLFPQHRQGSDVAQAALLQRGLKKSRQCLDTLDRSLIGPDQACLCGNAITIADYLGSSLLTVGEAIGCDLSEYPNIRRWLRTMRRLKGWPRVFAAFDSLVASLREKSFVKIQNEIPVSGAPPGGSLPAGHGPPGSCPVPHIGFLHAAVGAQFREASLGKRAALHQHHDVVAELGHQPHVVLDDQEGDAARLEREDVGDQPSRQRRVDAGGGLVEQNQLGLSHQRPAKLQKLLLAAREVYRAIVADLEEVEFARDCDRALAQFLLAHACGGRAQHGERERLAGLVLAIQHQVLDHRELRQPAGDLERAREPDPGQPVWPPAGDVGAVEVYRAVVRP